MSKTTYKTFTGTNEECWEHWDGLHDDHQCLELIVVDAMGNVCEPPCSRDMTIALAEFYDWKKEQVFAVVYCHPTPVGV